MAETTRPRHPQTKRKTPLEERSKILLGVIAIIVVAALVATLLGVKAANIGYRHVRAQFLQAAALMEGNAVTVAGIQVGTVSGMKLVGDHVEAELRVRNDVALGDQSRATIKVLTILGSRYLSLEPAGSGSLPDNTIDLAHTEVPYDLQQALTDATGTYEQMDFTNFGQSLGALGTQLKGLPPLIPQAMENLRRLADIVGTRRDQIGSLLKTTETVTNTLHSQQATVGSLVRQGNSLVGEFVERRAAFHAMLASLTDLVQTLNNIVVNDPLPAGVTYVGQSTVANGFLGSSGDYFDQFLAVAYNGSDGSINWTATWQDSQDSDEDAGSIQVVNSGNCSAGNCLRVRPQDTARFVYREASLVAPACPGSVPGCSRRCLGSVR